MSNTYRVTWEIDVEALSHLDAAIKVAGQCFQPRIQMGLPETACVFTVTQELPNGFHETKVIDLAELHSEQ